MKRKILTNKILFLPLLFFPLLFSASASRLPRQVFAPSRACGSFHTVDTAQFQEGDIILRRGSSMLSGMIAQAFPEAMGMSHCGILLHNQEGWQVVHSISGRLDSADGVRSEALEHFLANARGNCYYHVSPLFSIERARLAQSTRKQLDLGAAFDLDFDLDTSDKLYCSELLRVVYLDSGAEDIFKYQEIAGHCLVDLASFFDARFWVAKALPL